MKPFFCYKNYNNFIMQFLPLIWDRFILYWYHMFYFFNLTFFNICFEYTNHNCRIYFTNTHKKIKIFLLSQFFWMKCFSEPRVESNKDSTPSWFFCIQSETTSRAVYRYSLLWSRTTTLTTPLSINMSKFLYIYPWFFECFL